MPWLNPDQRRIVDVLVLDSTQDYDSSMLRQLMINLEIDSPYRVTYIQELLTKYEELQDAIDAVAPETLATTNAAGGIKRKTMHNDISIEYYQASTSTAAAAATTTSNDVRYRQQKQIAQRIRRYLDPCKFLSRYAGAGRLAH